MNEWVIAALVLIAGGLVPLGVVSCFSDVIEGVVALNLAGVIATLVLALLAEGFHRQPFIDMAVVLAFASVAGSLTFLRFLEREV